MSKAAKLIEKYKVDEGKKIFKKLDDDEVDDIQEEIESSILRMTTKALQDCQKKLTIDVSKYLKSTLDVGTKADMGHLKDFFDSSFEDVITGLADDGLYNILNPMYK